MSAIPTIDRQTVFRAIRKLAEYAEDDSIECETLHPLLAAFASGGMHNPNFLRLAARLDLNYRAAHYAIDELQEYAAKVVLSDRL